MLRSLSGTVLSVESSDKNGNHVLLDVNGLGFDILCSRAAIELCENNKPVRLVTHLQISEANIALYGFASEHERELFLKFTAIKGIGGRTGMAILSGLAVGEILHAVSFGDATVFTRVPGIGRKTAERLCFELKNLLSDVDLQDLQSLQNLQSGGATGTKGTGTASQSRTRVIETVTEALLSLGFQQSDARQAISLVRAARGGDSDNGGDFDNLSEEELLRLALKTLHTRH